MTYKLSQRQVHQKFMAWYEAMLHPNLDLTAEAMHISRSTLLVFKNQKAPISNLSLKRIDSFLERQIVSKIIT